MEKSLSLDILSRTDTLQDSFERATRSIEMFNQSNAWQESLERAARSMEMLSRSKCMAGIP